MQCLFSTQHKYAFLEGVIAVHDINIGIHVFIMQKLRVNGTCVTSRMIDGIYLLTLHSRSHGFGKLLLLCMLNNRCALVRFLFCVSCSLYFPVSIIWRMWKFHTDIITTVIVTEWCYVPDKIPSGISSIVWCLNSAKIVFTFHLIRVEKIKETF